MTEDPFTISDLWGLIVNVFHLPSSLAIDALMDTGFGVFMELSPASHDSGGATIFSVFVWLFLFFSITSWVNDAVQKRQLEKRREYSANGKYYRYGKFDNWRKVDDR